MQKAGIWLLCIIWTASAYAQTSFFKPAPDSVDLGFSVSKIADTTLLNVGLGYGITNNTKGFLTGGIAYIEDEDFEEIGASFNPSPILGVGLLTGSRLGQTKLEYFSQGSFSVMFSDIVDNTKRKLATSNVIGLGATLGILRRIETEAKQTIIPFARLAMSTAWINMKGTLTGEEVSGTDTTFGAQIGLEFGVSPTFSIGGDILFSFESSDITLSASAIFHPGNR